MIGVVRGHFTIIGRPRRPRILRLNRGGLVGILLVATWIVAVGIGPLFTAAPNQQDLSHSLQPPAWMAGGSSAHFLGTDLLGRDMLARILAGGRTSMLIGVCAVAVSCVIGVTLGAVAAEWGGWLDEVLMRIADVQLAIPFILLAVAVLLLAGGSDLNLVLVLGISGWVVLARVVRSELLHVRELDFVQASRALGGGRRHVIVRDLLPNVTGLILVTATFQLAEFILLESALSFLGIGIQPPQVSLGSILADGQNYLTTAWWIATFPGVAITTLILGVNLVGDSAGDSADPRAVRA